VPETSEIILLFKAGGRKLTTNITQDSLLNAHKSVGRMFKGVPLMAKILLKADNLI
jgi:hypothetical protein